MSLVPELLVEMQRRMWRIRAFDERAVEMRHAREIHGPVVSQNSIASFIKRIQVLGPPCSLQWIAPSRVLWDGWH